MSDRMFIVTVSDGHRDCTDEQIAAWLHNAGFTAALTGHEVGFGPVTNDVAASVGVTVIVAEQVGWIDPKNVFVSMHQDKTHPFPVYREVTDD